MKLSYLTLGALLLAVSVSCAQENPKREKSDTSKASTNSATKVGKKRPETVKKVQKKDTINSKTPSRIISDNYCPPCGMG